MSDEKHKGRSVVIRDMGMPTNCAKCPCLTITSYGASCGTPAGKGQRICADSLYFDECRPEWCPMEEVKKDGI